MMPLLMILVSVMLPVHKDIMVKTEDVMLAVVLVNNAGVQNLTNVLIVILITIYASTNVLPTFQLTIIEKFLLIHAKFAIVAAEPVGDRANGNVMTVSLVTII
jgi:hypothetical protein